MAALPGRSSGGFEQQQQQQNPNAERLEQRRHREQQHKACDVCKRRKVRCSGTDPCQQCQRNRSKCIYTSTYGKLTDLERRLRFAEQRVVQLESAWKHFLPDVDLEKAISTGQGLHSQDASPASLGSRKDHPASDSTISPPVEGTQEITQPLQSQDGSRSKSPDDLELDSTEALEWNETPAMMRIADGIGSLTLGGRASGYGYMGPQSGNSLLRHLQSVGNFLAEDGSDATSTAQLPQLRSSASKSRVDSNAFRSQCVDWYFQHFHSAYPILHEGCFRAQYMGALPKPKDGSWPLLLNVVLALGAFAGPQSSADYDLAFYDLARVALPVDLLYKGSLELVQAVSLLANYLQKRNKPNSGFTFLGVALHMALGLGLNREFSDTSINAFTRELRRRVWWTLYIFDSGARLTFGRPSMVLQGVNVRSPQNVEDIDLTVDMEKLDPPKDHPTATTSLIWQSKLARISNEANAKLLENRLPPRAEMLALEDAINSWWQSLPEYVKTPAMEHPWFEIPRMVLLWRSQHLRIVVCRPYLLDILRNRRALALDDPQGATERCISAAQECTQSISAFVGTYQVTHQALPGALTWYATYWLVTAVFIHVTCIVYDPSHASAGTWRLQVNEATETLQLLAAYEPLAARASYIITKIMDLIPSSPDMTTITFNESMRMGIADIWSESWFHTDPIMGDMAWANNQMPATTSSRGHGNMDTGELQE